MKEKSKKSSALFDVVLRLVIIGIFTSLGYTLYNQEKEMKTLNMQYSQAEHDYKEKQKELDGIKKDIGNVNSKEYIEKKARQDLKMLKEGEIVYIDKNRQKNLQEYR